MRVLLVALLRTRLESPSHSTYGGALGEHS